MSKIIGIDLGTTNSAVAYILNGNPEIIENTEGGRTTPSVVAVSKTNERLVGLLARRQAVTNPTNTIYGVKRFIGHRFKDSVVQSDMKTLPYEITEGPKGGVLITLNNEKKRPEEISAIILQKIKEDAEAKIGEKVTDAVITVPAYFDENQRKATQDAGEIAGLKVKRIINEPTAAALAYGFNKKKNEKIVVFDFGGGTFDVSVLEVGDDVVEVKSTDGDSHMGGRDIDYEIIQNIIKEFKKEIGIELKDPIALQRLDEAAEKAKIELSVSIETEINIPFITSTDSGPQHLVMKLSRATLEELSDKYIKRAIKITENALKASKLEKKDINEVIMVGGQTRMPAIHDAVSSFFDKEINKSINPDEVVALGAAVQAGILQGDVKDILLLDVVPISFGIETMGSVSTKIIDRNTTLPTSASQIFSTASDNQTSVDIHIVQGERAMAKDNKSLGRFILDGIAQAARGIPQIEVTFDIDSNGILDVKAKDKNSGKEQSIKIEASSELTDEDIEKMKKDAEVNAEEDKKKREVVEAKNLAEHTAYSLEKEMKTLSDSIDENLKKEGNEQIEFLRKITDKDSLEEIQKRVTSANEVLSKLTAAAKEKNNTTEDNKTEDQKENKDDNVTDADIKE